MLKHLTVIFCICLNFSLGNVFKNILEDSKPCESICENTYTLHTYPTAENLACCQRGCRFYTLIEIAHKEGLNSTKQLCFSACIDSYPKETESSACSLGCTSQVPFARQKHNEPQTAHLLTPFLYIQSVCTSLIDQMSHLMTSSWTFYVQKDTGNMVVVQQVVPSYSNLEAPLDVDMIEDADFFAEQAGISAVQLTLPQNAKRYGIAMGASSYNSHDPPSSLPQADWLSCISRQSGLPRWLLMVVLFLGVMVMVWLCCSSGPYDTPAIKSNVRKFNFQGDLDYLLVCQPAEEYKIQPSFQEAPPLPLKVNIPKV